VNLLNSLSISVSTPDCRKRVTGEDSVLRDDIKTTDPSTKAVSARVPTILKVVDLFIETKLCFKLIKLIKSQPIFKS
jgi:hypothetical protein